MPKADPSVFGLRSFQGERLLGRRRSLPHARQERRCTQLPSAATHAAAGCSDPTAHKPARAACRRQVGAGHHTQLPDGAQDHVQRPQERQGAVRLHLEDGRQRPRAAPAAPQDRCVSPAPQVAWGELPCLARHRRAVPSVFCAMSAARERTQRGCSASWRACTRRPFTSPPPLHPRRGCEADQGGAPGEGPLHLDHRARPAGALDRRLLRHLHRALELPVGLDCCRPATLPCQRVGRSGGAVEPLHAHRLKGYSTPQVAAKPFACAGLSRLRSPR